MYPRAVSIVRPGEDRGRDARIPARHADSRLARTPKPVVMAVNGIAAGGGYPVSTHAPVVRSYGTSGPNIVIHATCRNFLPLYTNSKEQAWPSNLPRSNPVSRETATSFSGRAGLGFASVAPKQPPECGVENGKRVNEPPQLMAPFFEV
jgi:hypothetical protein